MRKQLLRLALGLVAVAAAATPAVAFDAGCPSHYENDVMACHNTAGTSCSYCTYKCDNGDTYIWNTCAS